MITYITAFIFYTLAMIGILLVGFVIYKKTAVVSKNENKGIIKIVDSIAIAPKKMLLVVKVRDERFLIASGAEHTTFLSKLENPKIDVNIPTKQPQEQNIFETKIPEKEPGFDDVQRLKQQKIQKQFKKLYYDDLQSQNTLMEKTPNRKQMIKQLLKELNEGALK